MRELYEIKMGEETGNVRFVDDAGGKIREPKTQPGICRDPRNWSKMKSTTENTEGTEKEA